MAGKKSCQVFYLMQELNELLPQAICRNSTVKISKRRHDSCEFLIAMRYGFKVIQNKFLSKLKVRWPLKVYIQAFQVK